MAQQLCVLPDVQSTGDSICCVSGRTPDVLGAQSIDLLNGLATVLCWNKQNK
jgi:hypothetical protein